VGQSIEITISPNGNTISIKKAIEESSPGDIIEVLPAAYIRKISI